MVAAAWTAAAQNGLEWERGGCISVAQGYLPSPADRTTDAFKV
jgi:hypothetical protein